MSGTTAAPTFPAHALDDASRQRNQWLQTIPATKRGFWGGVVGHALGIAIAAVAMMTLPVW